MIVASDHPGPNNLLVATAGAHAGHRATLPHLLGIGIWAQFSGQLSAPQASARSSSPAPSSSAAEGIAAAYLAWLAFRLATASPPGEEVARGDGKPMSFIGAAAFQRINPA